VPGAVVVPVFIAKASARRYDPKQRCFSYLEIHAALRHFPSHPMNDQHCRRFDSALNRRDFLARAGVEMGLLALGAMAQAEEDRKILS
jgi:hypothetical protein